MGGGCDRLFELERMHAFPYDTREKWEAAVGNCPGTKTCRHTFLFLEHKLHCHNVGEFRERGARSRVPNAKITPSHLIGTVSLVNLVYCAAGIRYSVEAKPRQPPRLGLSIEAAAPDSFELLDFAAWNSRRETYFLR